MLGHQAYSFGICLSWGFWNYPRLLNLMKIWLSYWRLNTPNIISKFNFFSFQSKDENDVLSWIFSISTKSSSNSTIWGCFFWICSSWGFQNTPRLLNLMKIWQRYWRSKTTHHIQLYFKMKRSWILKWYQVCLTFNNSAKSSSNSTIWGSFEILTTSRFQNFPWVSDLMKIWWRK